MREDEEHELDRGGSGRRRCLIGCKKDDTATRKLLIDVL